MKTLKNRKVGLALSFALGLSACGSDESGSRGADSGTGGAANGGVSGGGSGGRAVGTGGSTGGNGAGSGGRSSSGGQGGASATGGQDAGSSGGAPGAGGAPVVTLPPGSGWLELADTQISPVCACNDGFPELCANSGCSGIFAWSSGAYDSRRNRLLVFGGGHSDYFGNEIYALSLADLTMARITDPGLPPSTDCSPAIVGGTQPSSRHTYDALLYLEHVDRLFLFGGSRSPCGYLADDTWTYSFADGAWEAHTPTGPTPNAVPGIVADYDPGTRKVLLHDDAALYSYDVDTDAFELLISDVAVDYHMSGIIDLAHQKLVLVGAGSVYSYDLAAGYARTLLTTTGGDSIVGSGYPGLAYDPGDGGRIVAWNGGDSAYALDLDTNAWTALNSPNGPGDANGTGTYKRWRYVPGNNAFVVVNRVDQNAYLFRL